ncbi:MAG TPA: shikimate kinase [Pyrinomonadaceae bacterium]
MKPDGPIVIIGFMACGKTEVARALAARLNLALVDLDDKIATLHGRTAAQLIDEEGEPAFRAIETQTLSEVLKTHTRSVIALGGGAWITDENRKLIAAHGGMTIWLDTPFEVCWQRIESAAEDRPLGRTRAQAEERFHSRRSIYQLAAIHINVMGHEAVDDVVTRITIALENTRE